MLCHLYIRLLKALKVETLSDECNHFLASTPNYACMYVGWYVYGNISIDIFMICRISLCVGMCVDMRVCVCAKQFSKILIVIYCMFSSARPATTTMAPTTTYWPWFQNNNNLTKHSDCAFICFHRQFSFSI